MNLEDLFAQTEDRPIPGGCQQCDASQVLVPISPGTYEMNVIHESWCDVPRSMTAETN